MPVDFTHRNALVAAFRRRVLTASGTHLLPHQAEVSLASEGWTLQPHAPRGGEYYTDVVLPVTSTPPDALVVGAQTVRGVACNVVRRCIIPRVGGTAHILADLAAFKGGKSWGASVWMSGFAALPDARVDIIGAEYSICEPEFQYLVDLLCSSSGMGMKYSVLHQDSNHGRMKLKLRTGAEFVCRSWERKENLKGKRRIAYCFVESYQLPGLEVYTSLSQNLRELEGFAYFPTTPDRPWVGVFHDYGHGHDPDWHCTCCVDARENPFTFDQKARDRDDPTKGGIMTRERFAIAWQGQLGRFIGRVYDFSRGDGSWYFNPASHAGLFYDPDRPDDVMHHAVT